jgi:hypothetical protein
MLAADGPAPLEVLCGREIFDEVVARVRQIEDEVSSDVDFPISAFGETRVTRHEMRLMPKRSWILLDANHAVVASGYLHSPRP